MNNPKNGGGDELQVYFSYFTKIKRTMDMQNEGGTIFSKKIERYVRKNIDFASFCYYFRDGCRHIDSGMGV